MNPLAQIHARLESSYAIASTCVIKRTRARLIVETMHRPTQERVEEIANRVGGVLVAASGNVVEITEAQ